MNMKIQLVLTIAMFAIVPLGLRIIARPHTGPSTTLLGRLAAAAPIVAIPSSATFFFSKGLFAAALALPWFVFTAVIATVGAGRVLSRRTLRSTGIGYDAALMFLVVGGAWLVITRAGLEPLGFNFAIVELTAVHFHYAGFVVPIMASVVTERLERSHLLPALVIVGVPLTAVGITVDGTTEWVAATFMSLVGIGVAIGTLQLSTRAAGSAGWLLKVAGLSLIGGMCFSLGWAWSQEFGWTYLDLSGMVSTHGMLNGFGFGLVGLIAVSLLPPIESAEPTEVCLHVGRVSDERLEQLRDTALDHDTTNPYGILNGPTPEGMAFKVWRKTIDHTDFHQAKEAIGAWAGHHLAGIDRMPAQPLIEVGETLAMAIPVGPLSVSATARVVEVFDEPNKFGFSYSTLPHHPEDGEESFIIHRHDDGTLEIVVTAMWRGAAVANHVLPPLTRFLQNRAIGQYLDGIAEFILDDLKIPAFTHNQCG